MSNRLKRVAAILAGVLLAVPLLSCTHFMNTAPVPKPLELISPETLYEKLLEDSHYQISAQYDVTTVDDTTAESYKRTLDYTMVKDGSAIKFRYKENPKAGGEYQEITYADLETEQYIYRDVLFDWVYDAPSKEYDNGNLAGYLYNVLPMDPEFMLEDRNYLDLAEGATVYEIDKEAFLEFVDEEDHPDLPVTLTMQVDGQCYLITTVYELSNGESVDSTVRITFNETAVELPKAKLATNYNDNPPKSPYYTGHFLETLLENKKSVTENGLIVKSSIRADSIETFENEGAECLFDGVDTYDEWYYDENGSLKEGGNPSLVKGGGPGKVCGNSGTDFAYFFFSTEKPVEVKAYVLTMANDAVNYARNPLYWVLLGSNDEAAADCTDFYDADWVTLDTVYQESLRYTDNFEQFGYAIDADRLEAYQHYCFIAISSNELLQLAELELYYTK